MLTWLYNGSGGSILLVTVWHGVYNTVGATGRDWHDRGGDQHPDPRTGSSSLSRSAHRATDDPPSWVAAVPLEVSLSMSSGTRRPAVLRLHGPRLRGPPRESPVDHGSKRRRGCDLGRRPVEGIGAGPVLGLAAAAAGWWAFCSGASVDRVAAVEADLASAQIRSACMSRFLAAKPVVELLPYGQGLQHVPVCRCG